MVTKGHVLTAITAGRKLNLKRIVISVNHNTSKNPKASVLEREAMLELAFKPFREEFEIIILPEPLEGRLALGRYYNKLYGERVVGIFGTDTLVRNYNMFFGEEYFELAEVERPNSGGTSETLEELVPMVRSISSRQERLPYTIELPDEKAPFLLDREFKNKLHKLSAPAGSVGLSSSLARALIEKQASSVEISRVIPESVYHYAHEKNHYRQRKIDIEAVTKEFETYKVELLRRLRKHAVFDAFDPALITLPDLAETQSPEAIRDVYVRVVVENINRVSPQLKYLIRRISDQYFERETLWKPLYQEKKTGLYMGSFDEINQAQIKTIEESLKQISLERIIVGVFDISPNPNKVIKNSAGARLALTQERLSHLGDRVIVTLLVKDDLLETIRDLCARHKHPVSIILGENVFDSISTKLVGVQNLKYAYVPFDTSGVMRAPEGVDIIKVFDDSSKLRPPQAEEKQPLMEH